MVGGGGFGFKYVEDLKLGLMKVVKWVEDGILDL